MVSREAPNPANGYHLEQVRLLHESFLRLTGRHLIGPDLAPSEAAERLFYASFALVSHDVSPDPVFNYANRTALELFEMTWEEFTAMPSRFSAEPLDQDERARQLALVRRQGYIDDYSGVRISAQGQRFRIDEAVVWNLTDAAGRYRGQAATFARWRFL